jgi:magnesium transporter
MITYYFKTVQDSELQTIEKPRNGVWAHVVSPTEEELETIMGEFALDSSILEDAQDFYEVPRFERSGAATYFFTRYPYAGGDEEIDTAPMLIVVGESFVLTVVQRETPFLDGIFKGAFKGKLEEMDDTATTQKTKLLIRIMTALTVSYEKELVRIRRSVHKDRAHLRKISTYDIERLVGYEHKLNDTLAAIVPTNSWLKQMLSGHYIQLFNDDVELMEDLQIANEQLVGSSTSVLKTIQNIRSASEAILTNSLNTTMRVLTALTILLTVPTIIASLYGMNVALPLANHAYAFWLIMVLIVAIVSVVAYYFRLNRWL